MMILATCAFALSIIAFTATLVCFRATKSVNDRTLMTFEAADEALDKIRGDIIDLRQEQVAQIKQLSAQTKLVETVSHIFGELIDKGTFALIEDAPAKTKRRTARRPNKKRA